MQTSHLIRRPAVLALMITGALAAPAAAATVDPDTLNPPPPPGADCRADGTWIICHTGLTYDNVNAPVDFGLPCGTIYETSNDVRRGIRWYARADRTIVKRFVTQDVEGTWSLSPTGTGPSVRLSAHANWRTLSIPDPSDVDGSPTVYHGVGLSVQAPGFGMIAHIAGSDEPDGTHHGTFALPEDPAVAAKLCTALGA